MSDQTFALLAMLTCGFALGVFAGPFAEALCARAGQRARERRERRERMQRLAILTDEEARAFKQIQRGYKQTAKEDR